MAFYLAVDHVAKTVTRINLLPQVAALPAVAQRRADAELDILKVDNPTRSVWVDENDNEVHPSDIDKVQEALGPGFNAISAQAAEGWTFIPSG